MNAAQEWIEILHSLECHHSIFYQLWKMGKPSFTDKVETAAVTFDKVGNFVNFLFNPNFWSELDHYNRLFVICHECLHIILNHGERIKDAKITNIQACNKCLDIVVNHALMDSFGFKPDKILNKDSYCWTHTVFPGESVSTKETFEYYYSLFEKLYGDGSPFEETYTVDEHHFLEEVGSSFIEELSGSVSDTEKGSLSFLERHSGTKEGNIWAILNVRPKVKRKWESVIKKWSCSSKAIVLREQDQWARLSRRLSSIESELFLPSDFDFESILLNRIRVGFFMDSSGSCWHLKERFFGAATSLDTKFFDVRLYCFDTGVYEVSLDEKKIFGGGGTSFATIEEFLQRDRKNYPDGVFVITDGYGDRVAPEFPNRWHWFLSDRSNSKRLPENSSVHVLSDFE